MDLSIIVVSYNTRDVLRDCLASVEREIGNLATEVFVVDNNSSDGSADMVESSFPRVRLIRNERNEGFAAANNIALRCAAAEFVLLLNSDTVVQAGAFHELIRFMRDTPKAGYCGPKLLNADGSHQGSAFRFPTILTGMLLTSMVGLARRYAHTRHVPSLHNAKGDDGVFQADWLCGACLMVRRNLIDTTGLLDDGYFLYCEEVDWCWRMAKARWQGWYVGTAEVVHLSGQSVVGGSDIDIFGGHIPEYHVRSHRRYMRLHHGLIAAMVSDVLQIAMYALVWQRNSWPFRDRTPEKKRRAAAALGYLTARAPKAAPR